MEKEVLTHERILQDYKDAFRSSYKPIVGFLIILICILALLILSTIRLYGSGIPFFLVILFDIMIVFFVWVCLGALISNYKNCQNIKSGQFYVVTDELIGKQEPESYPGTRLNAFAKSAELKFYAYGSFTMVSNHTSSNPDPYAVSDVDNYYSSSVGDKFLLVINKKSHILLAYNTKWFEYHE